LKNKKYNKRMRLYFGAMKYVVPEILKIEKNNSNFWNSLNLFMNECLIELNKNNKGDVVELFSRMCIYLTETYFNGLINVPGIDKNIDLELLELYKNEKEQTNYLKKEVL